MPVRDKSNFPDASASENELTIRSVPWSAKVRHDQGYLVAFLAHSAGRAACAVSISSFLSLIECTQTCTPLLSPEQLLDIAPIC